MYRPIMLFPGNQSHLDTGPGPDYSYSGKSKALMITSAALFAIAIVTIAITASSFATLGMGGIVLSGVVIFSGFTGGIGAAVQTSILHIDEIAAREFAYAETSKNFEVQIEYASFACQKGNKKAIKWVYKTGMKLMLEALNEIDQNKKKLNFEKGLNLFDLSASFSGQGLNKNTKLRNSLIKEFEKCNPDFKELAENYWESTVNKIYSDRMAYSHLSQPNYEKPIWKPTKLEQ